MSTQTLLASTTVTPSSPLGAFESFRYAPIPTTTIPAGEQFIIAALLPDSPLDEWLINDVHTNSVGITGAGGGKFEIGGTLSYPTQSASPFAVYSVANARTMVVPEPGTALLTIAGLLGPAGWRRART